MSSAVFSGREPLGRGVQVCRRRLEVAPSSDEQLGRELVQRAVLRHLVLHPGGVREHRLRVAAVLRVLVVRPDAEQLAPLHRPHVHELGPLQQCVDQCLALLRVLVREERVELLARRRQADQVEVNAAQELLVGTEVRRGEVQLLQLVEDERVDVVVFGRVRPDELVVGGKNDHFAADSELAEPGEDERPAAPAARHHAVLADGRDRLVVGQVQGEPGHVAHGTVRILRHHDGLLRLPLPGEHDFRWEQLDADRFGRVRRRRRGAGLQPAEQRLVVVVTGVKQLAAGVRNGPGDLFEHEALFRRGEVHAAADDRAGQAEVIAGRVVPEQRQHEPVLTASRSVATAVVAAVLHEHRHHVEPEADRPRPSPRPPTTTGTSAFRSPNSARSLVRPSFFATSVGR